MSSCRAKLRRRYTASAFGLHLSDEAEQRRQDVGPNDGAQDDEGDAADALDILGRADFEA